MGGFNQSTNQKSITIRDTIYNIDLDKRTVTDAGMPGMKQIQEILNNMPQVPGQ